MRWKTNSSAVHLHRLAERASASLSNGDPVVQIAPADFLFPELFAKNNYASINADEPDALTSSRLRSLEKPPVLILCTHAIEHAPDALAVLGDFHALLQSGGTLWLTAPFFYQGHHEPRDYARFTEAGLRRLLDQAGFEIQEIEWLEGYFGTLAYAFRIAFDALPASPRDYGGGAVGLLSAVFITLFVRPACALFASVLYRLDLRQKHTRSGHCKSFQIRAIRRT